MTAVALLILVWLIVLVPQAVKERAEQRREFVDSFHRNLEALARGEQPPVPQARRRRSPSERRRRIFAGLLVSVAVSAVPAFVVPGKASLVVHLAVDNCLLAYVGLLVQRRDNRARATAPPAAAVPSTGPEVVLAPGLVQPVLS